MRQIIQSFALGILVATGILFVSYYLDDEDSKSADTKSPSVEDIIAELESKGYIIKHKDNVETEEKKTSNANDDEENISQNDTNESLESDESLTPQTPEIGKEEPVTFVLTIKSGMTSNEIVDEIYNARLIDDVIAFRSYLEENGYNRRMQVGEYELNSTMTNKEIADIITK